MTAVAGLTVWGVGRLPFGLLPSLLTFTGTDVILLVTGECVNKRFIYRVDEAAAERIGRVIVAGAFAATVDGVNPGRVGSRLSFELSLTSRTERFRDGSGTGETDAQDCSGDPVLSFDEVVERAVEPVDEPFGE